MVTLVIRALAARIHPSSHRPYSKMIDCRITPDDDRLCLIFPA
jgi:hypothetical protein